MSALSHDPSQMFPYRTNSQQPIDGLYADVRKSYPEASTTISSAAADSGQTPLSDGLTDYQPDQSRTLSQSHTYIRHPNLTPQMHYEPWRFRPPLNSDFFSSPTFSNQIPGCFTPPSEDPSMLYHNEEFCLPISGIEMDMGVGMPLALPALEEGVHTGWMADRSPPQTASPDRFYASNPFGHYQTLIPSHVSDQPSAFESVDALGDSPPRDDCCIETERHYDSPIMDIPTRPDDICMSAPLPASPEKFRFQVTLIAPTAMVNKADEMPVAYLNKGHTYSILITDTAPPTPLPIPVQYRTAIRVSFEEGQQGHIPATRWQVWKEGRGTDKAHECGGKLQGVEYVEVHNVTEGDSRARANLEAAFIDGFSVLWTRFGGSGDCHVAVRFNFLSTDFSHSKGVKGMPIRLCAKTEVVSTASLHGSPEIPELCFCKIKVFREHGAERKLSNDIAAVKKTVAKLQQEIAQVKSVIKVSGKRKRDKSKHKRGWTMSSASPTEEDLSLELQKVQSMLTSTRPVSILYGRGRELDDPDLHPIQLTSEPPDLVKVEPKESAAGQQRSLNITRASTITTPLPIPGSAQPRGSRWEASAAELPILSQQGRLQPMAQTGSELQQLNPQHLPSLPDRPVEVRMLQQESPSTLARGMEALAVNSSSRSLLGRPIKPVACFYTLYRERDSPAKKEHYQAVYLIKREAKALLTSIAAKYSFEPTQFLQMIHVNQKGLNIIVDDDFVRELPEAQAMILQFSRITSTTEKRKRVNAAEAILDSEGGAIRNVIDSGGFILQLIF